MVRFVCVLTFFFRGVMIFCWLFDIAFVYYMFVCFLRFGFVVLVFFDVDCRFSTA